MSVEAQRGIQEIDRKKAEIEHTLRELERQREELQKALNPVQRMETGQILQIAGIIFILCLIIGTFWLALRNQ